MTWGGHNQRQQQCWSYIAVLSGRIEHGVEYDQQQSASPHNNRTRNCEKKMASRQVHMKISVSSAGSRAVVPASSYRFYTD